VNNSPHFKKYLVTGTPLSNKFGISPGNYYVACSVFPEMKPKTSWNTNERKEWTTRLAFTRFQDEMPSNTPNNPGLGASARDFTMAKNVEFELAKRASDRSLGSMSTAQMMQRLKEKRVSEDSTGSGYDRY
jgi:hypothetical protein